MKARVATQITIDADAAQVYSYLSDLRRHYLWNPHLLSISPLQPLDIGLTYHTKSLLLGMTVPGTNMVTKLEPNRAIEIENNAGILRWRATYRLKPQGKTTLVICSTKVASDNKAFAFAAPVLELLARRELQTDLRALKIAVEQKLQ